MKQTNEDGDLRFDRMGKCEGCGLNCSEWCPDVVAEEIARMKEKLEKKETLK